MIFEDLPADVQEIIDYTMLRKKYPKKDRELRILYGFGRSLTSRQMNRLFYVLKQHDKSHSPILIKCEQCGKKYDPDSDFLDEEDFDFDGNLKICVNDRDLCFTCKKLKMFKGGKK